MVPFREWKKLREENKHLQQALGKMTVERDILKDAVEIHVAFSLDCHDREAIAFEAKLYDLDHGDIMKLMNQTTVKRLGPTLERLPHRIQWLSDNGGQHTAEAAKEYGRAWGYEMRTTPAYSPESNGVSEAFVKTFKRDYVYANPLPDVVTVLKQLPKWFENYNKNAMPFVWRKRI
jgi:transposase InsO family protein